MQEVNIAPKTLRDIWQYFANDPDYERAFKTDFEFYKDQFHIEIYISVK